MMSPYSSALPFEPPVDAATECALTALHDAAWRAVADRKALPDSDIIPAPEPVPAQALIQESRYEARFPVLGHLEAAVALARQGPCAALAELFHDSVGSLRWSQNPNYTSENCERSFLDGYAYAALSGPEGPIHLDVPRGGFMLIGPEVFYPDHSHAAAEIYLVLTPGTRWRLDQGDWFTPSAGDLIRHRGWQMHGMQTGSTPLLAFAGWTEAGARLGIGFSDPATEGASR